MKAYLGVTDGEWYRYLADRPEHREANFWRPAGAREFRVLQTGEPFLFKTHYPHNRVVGGGLYSGFGRLRISEAWELFGEANGVATLQDMRRRVGRYRLQPLQQGEDPLIGCIFIRDTAFFEDAGFDPPQDFRPNIVQGKGYDLQVHPEAEYLRALVARVLDVGLSSTTDLVWHLEGPVYGDPRLAQQRLGQQAFQAVVLQAYDRRCAVTGDKIRPALEAAHVRPLKSGGEHRIDNGVLLRSDVHTLFDRGYLSIDNRWRLNVSPALRSEFGNGEHFYARAGSLIELPVRHHERPRAEFLEWHMDVIFRST